MNIQKVTGFGNPSYRGLWRSYGTTQEENQQGIMKIESLEYHAFKHDHIQSDLELAKIPHFLEFNKDKKPVFETRKISIYPTSLPFTEEEYKEFQKNPSLETRKNCLIQEVMHKRNLSDKEKIHKHQKNYITLGNPEGEDFFGTLILDEKAKDFVTPLERELIDATKDSTLTKDVVCGGESLLFRLGVYETPIKSKNPILNLLYKIIGREHPEIEKKVAYATAGKNGHWIYKNAKSVKEDVIKAYLDLISESKSKVTNWRLENLIKKFKI